YYAKESSPAGSAYRTLLALLRLTAIGLVLVMLSELLLTSSQRGQPKLYVIVDTSASMSLPATADDESPSRIEAARDLLLANDVPLLNKWLQEYELQVISAADGSTPLPHE